MHKNDSDGSMRIYIPDTADELLAAFNGGCGRYARVAIAFISDRKSYSSMKNYETFVRRYAFTIRVVGD